MTPLSQLFLTERHRQRAGHVGHSVPLASEIDTDDRTLEPVMVTTTRGKFLQSRVALGGYIRFGFSECPWEQEGALIFELHQRLIERAKMNGWDCVAASPEAAVARMRANGETPFQLAAGPWIEASEVDGVAVLDIGMPQGVALLAATPSKVGLHTRIGDYVGVVAYRVNHFFVAVVPE